MFFQKKYPEIGIFTSVSERFNRILFSRRYFDKARLCHRRFIRVFVTEYESGTIKIAP